MRKFTESSRFVRPALLAVLAVALLVRLWGITDRFPDPSLGIRVFDDSVVEETDRVTMGLAWNMWQGGTRDAALHVYLGVALRAAGRNEEALESFRRAFAIAPEREVRVYIAETVAVFGRRAEASDLYRHAAEEEPDPAQAQHLREEARGWGWSQGGVRVDFAAQADRVGRDTSVN